MRLRKGVGSTFIISLIFIGLLVGYIGFNKIEINNRVNSFGSSLSQSEITSNHNPPVKIKLGIWEAKTDIAFWTEKVKEYSIIKPNVTVEVETIPDNSGPYLNVRIAANDLPDLFY